MENLLDVFKALSDEARLRILRAVEIAELSVAEIVTALKMPQSSVSRHLKPLRDSGLLETRREGTSVYYRRGPVFQDASFAQLLSEKLAELRGASRDRAAVDKVLDQRRKESTKFFDEIAGRYGSLTEPGGGWRGMAAALAAGFSGKTVADIGCGEGDLTLLLARFAKRVTAIDLSAQMLRVVQERSAEAGVAGRVAAEKGDLEKLPLKANSEDAVFVSQVLHHAARPGRALKEAARTLKPDGQLILLDLSRHEQEWVRDEWADQWLGFDEKELRGWLKEAGLKIKIFQTLEGPETAFSVLMVVAEKQK
ncbi:ArsR/SmtB family transcription factor [Tichowtungia aerotolerans]|uniref:Metalloregulator ArsR/SmtB family transcription factor n=1 Tax=Tichowtungia aerotolerans TaxID=2697043 RepID=A0A6P1M455_9BACT|nr:metalloregulator ArsR/SmtB family transcription factor [Tichowtungia aerotolerans]QHI68617.1 metalloregulator ArsR/SmtB family transcription factor [Tichowtungia aerotolerans]